MPYRRLPNTDRARIRAMKSALNAYNKNSRGATVISPNNKYKLELNIQEFESALENYRQAYNVQKKHNKTYLELLHKTRLYLSHFIQILNFAIARGEYPKKIRKIYGFSSNTGTLPSLQTYEEIIAWSQKIFEGEQNRISKGGKPFQMPSIASINTLYERLKDSQVILQNLKRRTFNFRIKLIALRPEIDKFIKDVWDEIEKKFENYPPLIRREKAKSFGVIYFYRKNEGKIELKDLLRL